MKNARRFAILVIGLLLLPIVASAQTVIVVRHAQRADGGAGANSGKSMTDKPADPPLSAIGEARAEKLAEMLADAGVKHIFTTEFKRTQDTAKPLANKLGLKSVAVSSKEADVLLGLVRKASANEVVLVVGHSNTVPDIVRGLTGKTIEMKDEEYNAMYVLTPSARSVALIRW